MNNYFEQYKLALKQQWQSMDWVAKTFAVLISFILLISGFFTGLFIFSTSLVIAIALYIKSLFSKPPYLTK